MQCYIHLKCTHPFTYFHSSHTQTTIAYSLLFKHSSIFSSPPLQDRVIHAPWKEIVCCTPASGHVQSISFPFRPSPVSSINACNWAHSAPLKTNLTPNHNLTPHLMQQEIHGLSLFHWHRFFFNNCHYTEEHTILVSSISKSSPGDGVYTRTS